MAIVTRPAERREPVDRREAPLVSTVYLTDEGLRHARCGAVLAFLRRRQGIELIFHCRTCHEHIALTEYALSRIPQHARWEVEELRHPLSPVQA
jgi:hypothetical protein